MTSWPIWSFIALSLPQSVFFRPMMMRVVRRQRLFYVLHNCRVPVYEKDVRMDTPPLSDLTRFFQATILTGFLLLTCSCQWEESAYWSQRWPITPFVLLSILPTVYRHIGQQDTWTFDIWTFDDWTLENWTFLTSVVQRSVINNISYPQFQSSKV